MNLITITLLVTVAIILICLIALALIGLKEEKRKQKAFEEFNKSSIKSFMNGQNNKKMSRASTPKVKSIK